MTAQLSDLFELEGIEYDVAGVSDEGGLFDPSMIGLKPEMASTACWRGYQAVFGIEKDCLLLRTLHVSLDNLTRRKPPQINGVMAAGRQSEDDWFNTHYVKLNLPLTFSGGLLIAQGFIRRLYVHMGFHPAWKFEQVEELVFDGGLLLSRQDRSSQMAEIRKQMAESQKNRKGNSSLPLADEDIMNFVKSAFDRRYKYLNG